MVQDTTSSAGVTSAPKLKRSITALGFFGLCLSAVFGPSWLLTSSAWLTRAGGPTAVIVAFVLCFLVELPMILAYYEAVAMMPLAGGEMSYAYLVFGEAIGMFVGWFGVLVNIILCAWESLAIARLVNLLIPQSPDSGLGAIYDNGVLYEVAGSPVTIWTVVLGLALILLIAFIAHRGASLSARFGTAVTTFVSGTAFIMCIVAFFNFDPANYAPASTVFEVVDPSTGTTLAREMAKPIGVGAVGLLGMLLFSVAGWETVAKGAQEAAPTVPRETIGKMLVLAVLVATCLYTITSIAPTGLVPWPELANQDASFVYAIQQFGLPLLATVVIVSACAAVVGVYNAVFFAAVRQLYAMGEIGLVPKFLGKLHPVYKTPTNCIILVSAISAVFVFLGRSFFFPLIDVAAVSYVVLWGMTLVSVWRARTVYPNIHRPVRYPGGVALMIVGMVIAATLLALILIPFPGNPTALPNPAIEYPLLVGLIVLGAVLYAARDKSVSLEDNRAHMWDSIASFYEQ